MVDFAERLQYKRCTVKQTNEKQYKQEQNMKLIFTQYKIQPG